MLAARGNYDINCSGRLCCRSTVIWVVFIVSVLCRPSSGVDLRLDNASNLCDQDNIFRCGNESKQCIPPNLKCDGVANCDDGFDEAVEICGCLPAEFQCNTTTCINKLKRCDTHIDCDNGIDEIQCEFYTCPLTTHVKCENHFCVARDLTCDYKDDCGDNSDEKNCPKRPCYDNEFQCKNTQCVLWAFICDGVEDCYDGTDESPEECEKNFKCPIGFYINASQVCDGWNECPFVPTDELNCSAECGKNQYRCPNNQCINEGNVCDGVCDCMSCADEDNCETQACVKEEKFLCRSIWSARCIDKNRVCDKNNDCKDAKMGLDEYLCTSHKNCSIREIEERERFFFCPEGRCIRQKYKCDYYADCLNGEDEIGCEFPKCSSTEFTCRNRECVPLSARCNIHRDCKDWSDEMNCGQFVCPENTTKCHSGQCVPTEYWCDFNRDCPDGSDENECVHRPCREDEFTCNSGQCIDFSVVCSYDRDQLRKGCTDKSHLFNCSNHTCRPDELKCRNSYCVNRTRFCDGVIDCETTNSDEDKCAYLCPIEDKKCVCKLEEMNCENRQLTTMPSQQSKEHFTKLLFRGNRLNLTNKMFSEHKYYDKVTYLDLSNNSLTTIPIHVFDTMWQLTVLHLGDNNLTVIKNGTFIRLSMLRQLHLNGNKIKVIEEDAFVAMINLNSLDLSNQKLTYLYKNMFKGLKRISTLNLSGNKIHTIENGAFNTLINVLSIDLSNNKVKDIGEIVFLGLPRLERLITDSFRFCCLAHASVNCLPEPDEFSSCEDLMSNEILRVSIWVLGIIALCGNFVVIIWRVRDFRGGKVHSFLITNLAIGDFLMGVYLLIIATVDTHYRGVYIIHDKSWRESNLCQFAGFISTFSSELSVLTLTTITLDRLLCILFPLKRMRLGLKQALIVMSLIWGLVFLLAMLPLFGFSYFEGFYGRSGVCLALHVTPDRPPGWEYSVVVFLVLNFVTFLLISCSYLWMFSVAKKTRSAVRTAESKTDNAMARRMTIIVMTDFCCWIPIIVLGFVSLAGTRTDIQVYAWIAVFVLPLNSATNPIIYTLSTAPFLGNIRKRANRFRKSFVHSFTAETKNSYVDDPSSQSYCERKSPYRQLELMRLRTLNNSPPFYYKKDVTSGF